MNRLAILGASGHGKVVADAALASGWKTVCFFDDDWPTVSAIGSWPVVGATPDLIRNHEQFDGAVVAIGANAARLCRQRELVHSGVMLVSIVHPSAVVSPYANVGVGTVICAGAIVGPFARLGEGCIVNSCASVDHDCELADAVHISPGAHLGGGVQVGEASWIGIGAVVIPNRQVGAGVIVGAGAVVVSSVNGPVTVVGVPARPVKC